MISSFKPTRGLVLFGGLGLWLLLLVACETVNRYVVAPPLIAGAEIVGTKACAECHADKTDNFASASHDRLASANSALPSTACEACHGGGSLHVKAGGGRNNIVNPRRSPDSCFQCHLDKRAQFNLPNSHPLLSGQISCADCHDVHQGRAIRGKGEALKSMDDTCLQCHIAQKGPFVFEHNALRDGCVACHQPHGSVNQKMLVVRDQNLCLRCHLQGPVATAPGQFNANAIAQNGHAHNSDIQRGACWSAGCHESPHGSNADNLFRR